MPEQCFTELYISGPNVRVPCYGRREHTKLLLLLYTTMVPSLHFTFPTSIYQYDDRSLSPFPFLAAHARHPFYLSDQQLPFSPTQLTRYGSLFVLSTQHPIIALLKPVMLTFLLFLTIPSTTVLLLNDASFDTALFCTNSTER